MAIDMKTIARLNEYRSGAFGYKDIDLYASYQNPAAYSDDFQPFGTKIIVPITSKNAAAWASVPVDPDKPITDNSGFFPIPFRLLQAPAHLSGYVDLICKRYSSPYDAYVNIKYGTWNGSIWEAGSNIFPAHRATVGGTADTVDEAVRLQIPVDMFININRTSSPDQETIVIQTEYSGNEYKVQSAFFHLKMAAPII